MVVIEAVVVAVTGVSKSTFHKILKAEEYCSYKLHKDQDILPVDAIVLAEFCKTVLKTVNRNREIFSRICFSDECTYTLNNAPTV